MKQGLIERVNPKKLMEAHNRVTEAFMLKELRRIQGLIPFDICQKFRIEKGDYSRMEKGALDFKPEAKAFIIEAFKVYREERIAEIEKEIEYLNNIHPQLIK